MKLFLSFLLVVILTFAFPAAAKSESCDVTEDQISHYLTLSFEQFDQTEDSGWRPYYENRCYETAAELLVRYMEAHPELAAEHYMLPFHTGQMYALNGQHGKAIMHMKDGYSDIPSTFVNWNAFVDANVAFLEQDRDALLANKALITEQPPLPDAPGVPEWAVGKRMNLDVVEGFVNCFEESYETAYGDECRPGE